MPDVRLARAARALHRAERDPAASLVLNCGASQPSQMTIPSRMHRQLPVNPTSVAHLGNGPTQSS